MHYINDFLTLVVQNEHDLEHDLEHDSTKQKLFTNPKIYDADGDISKRWYVYFSYKDPKTGNLKRMKNIYGKINRHKTKEARYFLLSLYRKRLVKLLKDGYNPFDDNTEFYKNHNQSDSNSSIKELVLDETNGISKVSTEEPEAFEPMDVKTALDFALNLKTNIVGTRTLVDYKNRCELFYKWLIENHDQIKSISEVNKKIVTEFLNDIQLRTSARNRNNYRTCLGTIFQTLEDNELIDKNFVKNISTLKTNPERNKTYSIKQEEDIFNYLEEKDPVLLLFIKFISYNFLRPIEVCRLRVKDINIDEQILQIKVKNKALKKKIIPDILIQELPDLTKMDGDMLLFTPDSIGGVWDAELGNRRDYFTKHFKKIVKDHFGLDKNYGLYSFRHTFITKLYRAISKGSSPYAAKSQLMQITGHNTMKALEKYLRDIDAELPEDYSKFIKKEI